MKHGDIAISADVNPSSTQISVTPSGTISIDVTTGNVAKWTAGENETINLTGTMFVGQTLALIITNDSTLPRVITLGTGFRSLGTITGVVSKVSVIQFISNGTSMIEVARSVAMV